MLFIYVILLINNTYSIISSEERILHIDNTPNYKDIVEIIKSNDKSDFDKIVQKYISEFGYDNIKVKTSILKNDLEITEDDKKLVEYFDNITDVEAIEKEIEKLTMLKQKILHLKQIIATTNITFTEEYNFGKFISDYAKYKRFLKYPQSKHGNGFRMRNRNEFRTQEQYDEFMKPITPEFIELNSYFMDNNNDYSKSIRHKIDTNIQHINSCYHTYIQYEKNNHKLPSNFTPDTDVILQLYSTMYFNKKMNSHLTNFTTKNGTEEKLITKLTYAYSKILF
jgi:hypothetical protein